MLHQSSSHLFKFQAKFRAVSLFLYLSPPISVSNSVSISHSLSILSISLSHSLCLSLPLFLSLSSFSLPLSLCLSLSLTLSLSFSHSLLCLILRKYFSHSITGWMHREKRSEGWPLETMGYTNNSIISLSRWQRHRCNFVMVSTSVC